MPEMAEDVAIMYGVRVEDIRGWNRQVRFTVPRHHFAWLAYQQPHLSLNMIGQFLGGRDHSTVLNSLRRHAERMALEEAA